MQPDAEHSTLARVSDEDTRTHSYPPSTETGGGASEGHPCIVAETGYKELGLAEELPLQNFYSHVRSFLVQQSLSCKQTDWVRCKLLRE